MPMEVSMRVIRVVLAVIALVGATSAIAQIGRPPLQPLPPISAAPPAMPQGTPTPAPTPGPYVDDWQAYLMRYYTVQKVPKTQAIRISEKLAKPNAVTPWNMEIVGQDPEFVYLKNLPIENPESPAHNAWLAHEMTESNLSVIQERETKYFILDPFEPLVPPPFTDRIHLEERSLGLPAEGRWQMGFAHADFNHDGREDLVFPPARLGSPYPTIFLQTDTGWREWTEAKWPQAKLDYGDVAVADFDGDGNLDIAIACHFLRNYVLYGNGKGDFTRVIELPRINPSVTSRSIAVADFDGDGRPDVAVLSELDLELGTSQQIASGLLTVCLNTKAGWQAVDASSGRPNLFGDQLAVGDFDADSHPDILISSLKNVNRYLIYRNGGDGRSWAPITLDQFPFHAYIRGVAAANLDGVPGSEAVMGYYQSIQSGSQSFGRNAIAVYSFTPAPNGIEMKHRTMVAIDGSDYSAYTCAATGDVDGDGLADLVLGRQDGQVEIYLQERDGTYLKENSPELRLGDVWVNSAQVIKLTPKGPTAIVVATSEGAKAHGSIRCFVVRRGALDTAKRPQ
jgi:hypothetical protein